MKEKKQRYIRENSDTASDCPRFESCSAPICPLDEFQDYRDQLRGEQKCRLSKSRRHRIGKRAGLKREGLTKREWAAHNRWNRLSEDEKRMRTVHLKQFEIDCTREILLNEDQSTNGRAV